MRARRFHGFTLLELLIVVAIICVLATLILGGLSAARRRTQVAVARNNIAAIKAALQMYETDVGRYPCNPTHTTASGSALFNNDITFVWAALHNRRAVYYGGGPNSPYLDWKPEQVGQVNYTTIMQPQYGTNQDPNQSGLTIQFINTQANGGGGQNLDSNAYDGVMSNSISPSGTWGGFGNIGANGMSQPWGPMGSQALCFLDPWGNPYYYVEWADIPQATKDTASQNINVTMNTGGTGGSVQYQLIPHDPSKFDIYSFGPNGVNEGGNGDDITSWSSTTKN
ncbi:MAG TPA: prepilin-type N-terminal cleavage/methylation domain-containing protein [Planctomycetota bacterium]|nr:prepilin-type N-terminal cleavage/methylation domain-containing protein [Planctomycetota bacterium]